LIFDEATSSLDNVTEQKISHAIDSISREKTILIVAHRLSTVRFCDKLIFLSRGEVQAIGTYDQLIENNSNFRQLALVEGDNQQKFGTP
jgi:ABC-type multidrug transport system fused ATPase/permease subunit